MTKLQIISDKNTKSSKIKKLLVKKLNQEQFKKENEKNFYIYRVYEFLPEKMTGKIYMKKGSVEENFNLTPLQYKVSL